MFKSGLYIVSTPIGNLNDITFRSLEILKNSDIILCEDTRRSLKLLNNFNIKKKLISYHKFNEKKDLLKVINYLKEGKILSLISDAGTPVLSDPGLILIRECIKNNINVTPIPGASSITAAVSISGFDDKYLFYGFLPKTLNELNKILKELRNINYSIVFFIPANKINFYLNSFKIFFSGRKLLIAREITKMYETFYRYEIDKIKLTDLNLKGELTVVISKKINKDTFKNSKEIHKQAMKYLKKYSVKDVVELISIKEKISKKEIYKICLTIKKDEKNS
tara:strand:+ start:2914 stop:3750 length:837 start_codon:yes stop_codon:yes gene_type:complete